MPAKKVALLGLRDNFNRDTGAGVTSYMYELARHFKKLAPKYGFHTSVLPYERGSSELSGFLNMAIGSMARDYSQFDIVHNLDVKPIYPMSRGKALFVATAHDYQPLLAPELDTDMQNSLRERIKLEFEIRYSLRLTLKADYIISRSSLTKNDAAHLGFDRKRIFVVGGAVDDRYRKPIPQKKKQDQFVVGYIGAFRTRKNVSFAIDAFNRISDNGIRFDLWGKPAYEYDMLRQSATNQNIIFKGFAPEEKLVQVYDSFDVFVFPSLYEGLCLPIFEAQARGLPVIICSEGKIPDETRRYCFEVGSGQEMARTIEHLKANGYDERQKRRAMAYARSFTWEQTAKDTLAVYKKILS